MEDNKNLEELTTEVSILLLNCITLLEIFYETTEGERKASFFISLLQKYIQDAFNYTEQSRYLISKPD